MKPSNTAFITYNSVDSKLEIADMSDTTLKARTFEIEIKLNDSVSVNTYKMTFKIVELSESLQVDTIQANSTAGESSVIETVSTTSSNNTVTET